jgi:hypothetical protein
MPVRAAACTRLGTGVISQALLPEAVPVFFEDRRDPG